MKKTKESQIEAFFLLCQKNVSNAVLDYHFRVLDGNSVRVLNMMKEM